MTQKKYYSLFVFVGLMFACQLAVAQKVHKKGAEEKETKAKEPSDFKSKLWYGGGLQLGFNSYFGSNVFSFGVSPMVGYKIIKQISVGPRLETTYTSYKQSGYKAISLFDVDAGVFVRGKIFRGLFIQGELSNTWYQVPLDASGTKFKGQRFNQRVGLGWNFGNGQGGGSEIGVFYNFAIAQDINSQENPLGYRFGFTWNF